MGARARSRLMFVLVAVWFAVLFWLSSQSHLQPPGPEFANKDKVLHTGYFLLGGIFFFLGLRFRNPTLGVLAASILTVVFCSAVGSFDEWHQQFTPGRSANDFWDWTADTLGGILGALAGQKILRLSSWS